MGNGGAASFSLFALIDRENQTSRREIRVPYLLSVLAYNDTTSAVEGMRELRKKSEEAYGEGDYIPPVAVVYWSFRVMVGLGFVFIFFSFWGLWLWWRGRLPQCLPFHRVALSMILLPVFANTAGWIVTEMGRQPWVVYGLLKTTDGISPIVGSTTIWISMIGFTVIYGVLAAAGAYLIHRLGHPDAHLAGEGGQSGDHAY